ncbi:hypothetical protein D9619_012261 [Psilocybe cf. subviscida]|uniref:EGF-like domain-containing protein n=1 Tax=Psilocybe cf. subviscida TaxID=2480587 RepID=A0A8H5B7Q4_9AGAR|nr:hypothetical protein D9619_012261 [Psilocybe cf. subviscida]
MPKPYCLLAGSLFSIDRLFPPNGHEQWPPTAIPWTAALTAEILLLLHFNHYLLLGIDDLMSMFSVVLYFALFASAVAQSTTSSVVCVAGQCLQGSSNISIGAKLSQGSSSVLLLPGQYTDTTNPQLLHTLLTSSSSTLSPASGFENATLSLPLNLQLQPGLSIYSAPRYSGQSAFSALPSVPIANTSTPLAANSLVPSTNVWVAVSAGASNSRIILWEAVPDVSQITSQPLSLLDMQSNACSPACSGQGVCSSSGTCVCPEGFAGSSCETCAKGFFGPTCQPCPDNCTTCDEGISGSGQCLVPAVANAPSTCNCLNGQCGSTGQCTCNPGWTTGDDGTSCAKCSPGFFLTSTGDCEVCQLGCSSCADQSGTCTTCASGFTLDASDKTKCDPLPTINSAGVQCPDGSFSDSGTCQKCSGACRTCKGPSSNDCLLCAAGTYMFNGACVSVNTDGVCQGTNGMVADNNKNECETCGAKCTSCTIPNFDVASTISQAQCTGCLPGSVLSKGKCVSSCPAGTFVSPQDNLTCIPCSTSCGTCVGTANFCLTCPPGQLASGGQCVSTCPSNTFTSDGSCVKCHPDCATCSGPSFNQCSTCNSARPVLTSGRCLPTCTKSQYFDTTSSSCQACDSSCSSCSGPGANRCLACASSTQVLRAGTCVSANCNSSSNVIPGLGVCLSELVVVPTVSGTAAPLPSITGLSDPIVINTRRGLEWWQILLMALGCAFIFVVVVMCARRRAKNQRAKRTAMFAEAKRLNNPRTWRQKLVRMGEKLFGHRGNKLQKGVIPVAYNRYNDPRSSVYSDNLDKDIKMTNLGAPSMRSGGSDTLKVAPAPPRRVPVPGINTKKPKDAVDQVLDSYFDDDNHSAYTRSSRAPSSLPGLAEREHAYKKSQLRVEQNSLYHETTDRLPRQPQPRQMLRREPSTASRYSTSTFGQSMRRRDLTGVGAGKAKEGVLVDFDDEEEERSPTLPLQNVLATRLTPPPTEAQAYANSVRPQYTGSSQTYQPQQYLSATTSSPALVPQMTMNLPTTNGSFMPISVTLTPNTTGGQGSYWMTPVTAQAQQAVLPATTLQPQQQQQFLHMPAQDTVVLQPMNTGGSFSRNPFRQGMY